MEGGVWDGDRSPDDRGKEVIWYRHGTVAVSGGARTVTILGVLIFFWK